MELKTKKIDNVIEIFLYGRLDIHLSVDAEEEISNIISREPNSHLLLNLIDVEYMSSSGIRMLVSIMRRLKESKRKLKICGMNNDVRKIFEIIELIEMFDIYDNEQEAIDSFSAADGNI